MKLIFTSFLACLLSLASYSQLVINELDSDTPGQDFQEFIELKSDTPNFPLDGYVVVLFNGSTSGNDSSYFAVDLDGYQTDINGILVIGSTGVSPIPELLIPPLVIQNGADAVAIYLGDATDFPEFTPATTTNLIDALVYDTSDPDDTALMALLGVTEQINEDENGNATTESIQRNNDGTYTVTTPTPGETNDGSGVDLNGISFTTDQDEYEEGEVMTITFTTEFNVTNDLNLDFTLDNETFTTADFTGNTSFTISAGTNSEVVQIQLVADGINDGDEFLEIDLGFIPQGFNRIRDNVQILVIDQDFTQADYGTPLNPTYGMVASTQPSGYYSSLTGLGGEDLRLAMQDIISDPAVVRAQTYADVVDILKEADQNPENSNEVWLFYTEQARAKYLYQNTGGSNVGLWNREHTYPQSRGGFYTIEYDEVADGRDLFLVSSADSLRHGISEVHGLRAADGPENSSRNNSDYGEYDGPAGNLGSWKGDAARAVMYMAVRFNNLELVNGDPANTTVGQLGDLETLLDWHRNDPPDDFEMHRNNVIYTWQFNRNPFIDRPDLVEYIYGNMMGEIYNPGLGIGSETLSEINVYPNPSSGTFNVAGISEDTKLTVTDISGKVILKSERIENGTFTLNLPSGLYIATFENAANVETFKLVIE
ncbi:endonuclease [Aequorivita echinoideorum]|uniref:Endonuclease n=1 Tax=Aequorivita echinoideorum TaxID=1549647 RepID=A0ABS5S6Q6_9FLAO|nr:endonuclease [Aequorivita echinoideorum]MBT0608886.1 endonuclease [Aequorivita echinoideorum]